MVFTSTAVPSLRLHVQDLPEAIDILTPGGVYALVVDTPPSRFPLLAACIGGALGQGLLTSLLLATPPQPWLERLAQLGLPSPDEAVQTGRLQVFSQQTDFTKKLFRHGTPAFVQELEYFGLPRDSLLVVDQADDLLSLHDMGLASGQAEVLSHWARAQGITLLLVFNRVAAVAGAAACLNGLMDSLRGIARLGGHGDGLNLRFDYWQSPGGTVAAKDFALSIQDNGWYKVRALVPQAGTGLVRADAEHPEDAESHNFYYLDDPLDTLSQMVPGQWRKVDSVMSILREAVGTSTPSVLLCFKAGQSLRGLAESVHALRLALGRRARIVVVERDMSLRYANEVLLLRLGANLIMHRDMSEARMVLTLNYSSRSIAARYSAAQLGLEHTSDMSLGEFSVNAQAYQVSDSNSVLSSQFRFTPAWRPLGPGFKTFAAIDTRQARFNTIDYWSPADGYGTASLGVSQAWEAADWNLFASAQVGNRLYGEGGPTWSAGLSGKRWISPDYALGFNATTLSNRRDDAAYRASFVNVNVEKLW